MSKLVLLLGVVLIACTEHAAHNAEGECFEAPPPEGTVRAKRIACAEELPEGAEAEIGDWLLENHLVRMTVRDATHRLTQLEGTGGTILDIALQGGIDAVTEMYPVFDTKWPDSATISAVEEGIRVESSDGSGHMWTYRLSPNQGLLQVDGATGFTLVPAHGAYKTGDLIQSAHDFPLTVGALGGITDDGGWVHWNNTNQLALGSIDDIAGALYTNVTRATGLTDGSALQVQSETFEYAFWIEDGAFDIQVPVGCKIRALRSGYAPSAWTDPNENMNLSLGNEGFINATITNESGDPISATLNWNGRQFHLQPETVRVPVGPGEGSGWIDAGPRYEHTVIENQLVSGTVGLDISMTTAVSDAALVAVDVPAFPDRHERRFTDDLLIGLAARSVDYVIFSAGDEVAQASPSEDLAVDISFHAGSRSESDMGTPIAFPWSNNRREPAHGAAPWQDLGPLDLLAYMAKSGRRTTIVDRQWVEAAGEPVNWDPIPNWFIVREFEDMWTYTHLLDQWIPATVLGKDTWVATTENHRTAILRGILAGKTTATTGPQILFSINDSHQGANLYSEFADIEFDPVVQITVQNAGDLERLSLIGSGGVELISWKIGSPPTHFPLSESSWVLIAAQGETDWAVTNPIWLKRP